MDCVCSPVMEWVGKMKIGDLVKRKWDKTRATTGLVVGFKDYRGSNAGWVVVLWAKGSNNYMYHPDNLEVLNESR